ncbi:hypothetical protein PMEGAPL103_56910 [Priestia megaterium]
MAQYPYTIINYIKKDKEILVYIIERLVTIMFLTGSKKELGSIDLSSLPVIPNKNSDYY